MVCSEPLYNLRLVLFNRTQFGILCFFSGPGALVDFALHLRCYLFTHLCPDTFQIPS